MARKRVLIIAQDNWTRAYIGGQLEEEGAEAFGVEDVSSAISLLKGSRLVPNVVIIDTQGLILDKPDVNALAKQCKGAPLVVVHGAWDDVSKLKWDGEVRKLPRPASVGEVVRAVEEMVGKRDDPHPNPLPSRERE